MTLRDVWRRDLSTIGYVILACGMAMTLALQGINSTDDEQRARTAFEYACQAASENRTIVREVVYEIVGDSTDPVALNALNIVDRLAPPLDCETYPPEVK